MQHVGGDSAKDAQDVQGGDPREHDVDQAACKRNLVVKDDVVPYRHALGLVPCVMA